MMKKILLFLLALAVIPVGVDAQVTPSVACADLSYPSAVSLEDTLTCAEQGYALAQWMMGQRYTGHVGDEQFGDHLSIYGVLEDRAESARWYRLAAEHGEASAQSNLGAMYDTGEGVPEDDVEAAVQYGATPQRLRPSTPRSGSVETITLVPQDASASGTTNGCRSNIASGTAGGGTSL